MKSRTSRILVLLVGMMVVLMACKQAAPPLGLKDLGPKKIRAGQDFNVQPNGQSALWVKTENATKTTVIVWGETPLKTAFGSAKGLTALVPKELYEKSGQYQVYLKDNQTGAKSAPVTIPVE